MTLYKIQNTKNGHFYVGITTRSFRKRRTEHLTQLRDGTHGNRYLQAAWNLYGEESFDFSVVSTFESIENLVKAEKDEIESCWDTVYNLSEGGFVHTHTSDAKKAIGEANKRPVVGMCVKTKEIRFYDTVLDTKRDGFNVENIGGACRLAQYSTFKRISVKGWVWMYKKDFSLQEIERRRELALVGKVRVEKAVVGMNVQTGECVEYKSSAASKDGGFLPSTVGRACRGQIRMHKGFVWSFKNIENFKSVLFDKAKKIEINPPRGPKSWQ